MSDTEIDDAMRCLQTEGYAKIPAVANAGTLSVLRVRADEIATGIIAYPEMFFQPDTPTGKYDDLQFGQGWAGPETNYRKIEKLELDPIFRGWLENATFERIVRRVIPGDVSIYRSVIFSKAPRVGSDLPWHQDGGQFWGLDRDPELQIWTALDNAPKEAGCLEVFPKSHLAGLATPLGGVVPKTHPRTTRAEAECVAIPCVAGDVLLLHNYLWHRSGPNTTDSPRRGITTCYMPAETRCLRKKRAPRQFVRVFRRL